MSVGTNDTFQTMRQLVARNAALFPHKMAMKEFETGKSHTFGQLKERVERLGAALYGLGLSPLDRVAVLSQNSFEYAELFISVPASGLTLVPLNFRLALPELIGVLSDAGAKVLFLHDQYRGFADELKKQVPSLEHFIFIGPEERAPSGWYKYDPFVASAPADLTERTIHENDAAFFMYTSGTTGLPKGVVQTHLNHYHLARTTVIHHDLKHWDIGFTCCPMYHATAYCSFFGTFFAGATNILFQKFDPATLFQAAQDYRITAGMLATPMVRMILDASDKLRGYDYTSLKKLWFAGAGITPSVWKQFIDIYGSILGQHMGTTETTGSSTFISKEEVARELALGNERILASCGTASVDMDTQIVDDNDCLVTHGIGEMRCRGLGLSKGYWNKEEQTNHAFRNGWFYTEDICEVDEKGYIYVIDRKKDMIITGGENVYPTEIETVINEHPAVKESTVIGLPHPVWGESIAAVVVCHSQVTPDDIISFCKGRIGGYKTPKAVYFLSDLPRNASGKILKAELRRQFAV